MKKLFVLAICCLVTAAYADDLLVNPGVSPAWTSEFDAVWGCAAVEANPSSGGASGAYFEATRSCGQGSSAWVIVRPAQAGSGNLRGYLRRGDTDNNHWVEYAYADGSDTAEHFDAGGGLTWNLIMKFDGFGTADPPNGNGNTWTQYSLGVSLAGPSVSLGAKYGSSGQASSSPAGWDEWLIESPLETENWMLY